MYEVAKNRFGRSGTPIKMPTDPLSPFFNYFTSFLLACCKEFLGDRTCHMPDVIIVCCFFTDFSYPFGNPSVPFRHKDTNFQARLLRKFKATFCSFKFSLLATPVSFGYRNRNTSSLSLKDCTANVVVAITA